MLTQTRISIPSLVRIKSGALDRLGIYCARHGFGKVAVISNTDMPAPLTETIAMSLATADINIIQKIQVIEASFDEARRIFAGLSPNTTAIIGFGGGKALDIAKYVSFLANLPYIAVPTSLSNDGFASPTSSLTIEGRKRSLRSTMPFGIVIDVDVCLAAPLPLWLSGVGDLAAKFTAVRDWKLAFAANGEPVNDFAALLSDATVFQFISRPVHDAEGARLLGTSLMLNGIAMEVCGSSRPASGSEHLISHALDQLSTRPRLHGLQVGLATFIVSCLQNWKSDLIEEFFNVTGFWDAIHSDPFIYNEWIEAVKLATSIKPGFYTVLSSRDCVPEVISLMETHPALKSCFSI